MPGRFKVMSAALAVVAVASCSGPGSVAQPSATPLLTFSPSPVAVSPSPSPPPLQRLEKPLPAAVEETAAAATDTYLYVIGGFDAAGNSLRSMYVFDGRSWSAGPRLPIGLDHAAAATLDGRVYVAGGHSFGRDSARVFRLNGAAWTDVAPLHHARGGHALVALGGKLYAIGGNTAAGQVAATEVYDPSVNRWSDLPSLPLPRNHVAGFVFQGKACVAGGRSPNSTRVDCFDPATRAWSRLGNLPMATSGAGAATFESGQVLVMGGEDAAESKLVVQRVHLNLDGSWGVPVAMLQPRHGFELAVFQGRAWACGGGAAPGLHPVASCTSAV